MSGIRIVLSGIEKVPIVHCHIPRTGGMSVDYYFRQVFGDDNCVRLGSDEDFIRIGNPHDPFYWFRWKYLSAHLPAREIMKIMGGRKYFMFTIVRNPVEREISAFKNIVEHHYMGHVQGVKTFDDYLSMKESRREMNTQCDFIQMHDQPARAVSADLLQFISGGHAILSIEKNYALQEYMRATLGSSYIIEPHNVSTITRFDLTERQRRRLMPLVERDIELYELVHAAEQTGDLLNDWRISWQESPPPPACSDDAPAPHP